jgi:hypothetical protein
VADVRAAVIVGMELPSPLTLCITRAVMIDSLKENA